MNNRYEELKAAYEKFDREHPEVWKMFVQFTLDRIYRGFDNYSVNGVFERIRWECAEPSYTEGEEFKLNNNHRPFYARRFMEEYPRYDEFFRTRHQTSRDTFPTHMSELGPKYFQ
jgi:hypothetical protein